MFSKSKLIHILLILTAIVLSTGCISWEGKFYKTKTANVSAFADHTISMLSDTDIAITKNKALYVREYVDPNSKEEQEYSALINETEILMKGIVKYSVDLVTIVETYKDELERIKSTS